MAEVNDSPRSNQSGESTKVDPDTPTKHKVLREHQVLIKLPQDKEDSIKTESMHDNIILGNMKKFCKSLGALLKTPLSLTLLLVGAKMEA